MVRVLQQVIESVCFHLFGAGVLAFGEHGYFVFQGNVTHRNGIVSEGLPIGLIPYGLGGECHHKTDLWQVVCGTESGRELLAITLVGTCFVDGHGLA